MSFSLGCWKYLYLIDLSKKTSQIDRNGFSDSNRVWIRDLTRYLLGHSDFRYKSCCSFDVYIDLLFRFPQVLAIFSICCSVFSDPQDKSVLLYVSLSDNHCPFSLLFSLFKYTRTVLDVFKNNCAYTETSIRERETLPDYRLQTDSNMILSLLIYFANIYVTIS